MENKMLAEA